MTTKKRVVNVRIPENQKELFYQNLPKIKEKLKEIVEHGNIDKNEVLRLNYKDLYEAVVGFRVDTDTYFELKAFTNDTGIPISTLVRYIFYKILNEKK